MEEHRRHSKGSREKGYSFEHRDEKGYSSKHDRNRQKKSEDGHSRPINKYEENEVRRERFTRGALDSDRPRSRDIEKEIERETSWHRKAHDALSTFRDEELRKDMRGDLDIRGHRRQTVDGYELAFRESGTVNSNGDSIKHLQSSPGSRTRHDEHNGHSRNSQIGDYRRSNSRNKYHRRSEDRERKYNGSRAYSRRKDDSSRSRTRRESDYDKGSDLPPSRRKLEDERRSLSLERKGKQLDRDTLSSESSDSDESTGSEESNKEKRPFKKKSRYSNSPSRSPSCSENSSRNRSRERSQRKHRSSNKGREKRRERDRSSSPERKRRKKKDKKKASENKEERRSVLTGKKIKLKVKKDKEDHKRDANREDLLKFLNSAFE